MTTRLLFDDHLKALAASGAVLRDAAAQAGLSALVPTCPGWDVRELLTHQGSVHRWAAANLRGDRGFRMEDAVAEAAAAPDLLDWFTAGLDGIVETLLAAPEDVEALVFLNDAPPPREFWARRQAHETMIHCADAIAAALGRPPLASEMTIDLAIAVDGIDELLHGSLTRGTGKLNSAEPFAIAVEPSDADRAWTMFIAEASLTTTDGADESAAGVFSGTAAQLYLGLWNRGEEMTATGRPGLLRLWREHANIQ